MAVWVTVVGATGAALTGASAAIGGGQGGGQGATGGYQASKMDLRRARREFQRLDVPSPEDLMVAIQQAVMVGKMTPIQGMAVLQRESAMQGVRADPRAVYEQMSALEQMGRTIDAKGMTESDRISLIQTMQDQTTSTRGARERNLQGLAERGQLDQGAVALDRDVAAQSAANRGARAATQVAADAEGRLASAIQAKGRLAGDIRSQAYDEDMRRAAAGDEIALSNATWQNRFAADNASAIRAAKLYNADTAQKIADLNTQMGNAASKYNAGVFQQDFENRMARARGIAGTRDLGSEIASKQQSNLGQWQGALATAGTLASKFAKYF